MLNDWNFGLKQRFSIKCSIDLAMFIMISALFVIFALKHSISSYETLTYLVVIMAVVIPVQIGTRQWISRSITKLLTIQSESMSDSVSEIVETLNSQKRILENLAANTKNVSSLIEKLKNISVETVQTSKNTEKQVSQSISCSQKEHEAISANSETLLNYIENILDSLGTLNQNAVKQGDIIEKLHLIDEENKNISDSLVQIMSSNSERLAKLNNLSNEIKNSAIEG